MSTRCYKTKTEPTKGFCCFHQPRAWIPGRKARAGLQPPLPDGGSALQHGGCSSSHSWRCSEKHKTVEIPTSTETTSLFWTLMCFGLQPTQTSCSDVTQQCLASRKMPMAGEGACARAGGRAPLGSAPGPPGHPCALSGSVNPVSTGIPENIHHKKSKSTQQAMRSPSVWLGEEYPRDNLKTKRKSLQNFKLWDESMLEHKKSRTVIHLPPAFPRKIHPWSWGGKWSSFS